MKKLTLGMLIVTLLFVVSCNKSASTDGGLSNSKTETEAVGLEQETKLLQDENGQVAQVTYFAKGDQVAVRVKIADKEREFTAKGINERGEAEFANDDETWTLLSDGQSGKLTDKNKKSTVYKDRN